MTSPLSYALVQRQPIVPPPQTQVSPTNVVGAYQVAEQAAMDRYKAQIAQQNAMWGGLAGLGGAGITAFGPKMASGFGSMFGGAGAAGMGADAAAGGADLAAAGGATDLLPLLALA